MRRRSFLGSTAALSGLGVLAACAPGSDDGDGAGPGPGADEVETDIAALGDITLTMWDQEVRGAQNDAIEALIEAFQDEYPNVTIERNSQSFDDLQQQTGLALSGNDVPDVLQRSEEHTSELQSRGHLVCRLLPEKTTTRPCSRRMPAIKRRPVPRSQSRASDT